MFSRILLSVLTYINRFEVYMTERIKIQKNFTDMQRTICKNLFDLTKDETLMFIWWVNPLQEKCFVFTDKRVLWNIPAKISGENDIEIYHQNNGEILFESKSFLEITIEKNELIIHTKEKRYGVGIGKKLSAGFMNQMFKDYFEEMRVPADEYCTFNNSFILRLEGFLQKLSIPESGENKVYKTAYKKKNGSRKIKYTALKTASFIRHVFDFILDINSFLVLSFCFLINATINNPVIKSIYDEVRNFSSRFNYLVLILCVCCIYFILKTLIVFTTRNIKKLPAILLIVVQILVWLIANEKYAFLLTINFLITYIFQRICNFSKTSIRLKFTLYFAILIAAYLSITYIV